MSEKAFRQFVTEVRVACDRYLAGGEAPAALKRVTRENVGEHPYFAKKPAVKGNPICRCGHNYGVHDEPHDDARGKPANICRGCEADGVKLGCPEFVKKGTLPTQSNGAASVDGLTACHRAILAALLANSHTTWTQQQISILTVYTQSGTFNMAMADLREMGLIEGSPGLELTAEGKKTAHDVGAAYDAGSLRTAWAAKLKVEVARRIIIQLSIRRAESAAELAERCGYTTSGTYNSMLAKLRRMGIIESGTPIALCQELL
jgi:hypothetical protein